MTAILAAIYLGHRPGADPATGVQDKALVFVSGLTDPEKAFIQANRLQLGSGKAKHLLDTVHAYWKLFRSLPIVVQLLLLISVVMTVIVSPYVGSVMMEAMKVPQHAGMRMIVSTASVIVLFVTTILVLLLL